MTFRKILLLVSVLVAHIAVLAVVFISSKPSSDSVDEKENIEQADKAPDPIEALTPVVNNDSNASGQEEQIHVIKRGDSLSKVASRYKLSLNELCDYNQISNPNKIRIGQKIRIPKAK